MHEVEIKVLDIDREKTELRLIELGARKIFDAEIHAIYYDYPDSSIRKAGGTIRLRTEGERAVLTFKRHVESKDMKIREEKEVDVSDFSAMREILEACGMSSWLEMKKHRTTYELNGTHYEFDKYHDAYAYIPEFLEIEGTDPMTVRECAELLGFSRQDCRPWDAVQVAEYYARLGGKA